MNRYRLGHLDVSRLAQSRPYKSGDTGRKERIRRIREKHGPLLIDDYERAFDGAISRQECIPDAVDLLEEFGLRFDLKRARETREQFLRRRNLEERTGDERVSPSVRDRSWLLGEKNTASGSLHCDIWTGTAVELASRNLIWVYPGSGWWRERKSHQRFNDKARYALILSLMTEDQSVDLHAEISNILLKVETEVEQSLP